MTHKVPNVKQFTGFLSADAPSGFARLCNSPEGDDCLEICDDDIRRSETIKTPDGVKQAVLFVERNATIVRRTNLSITREAEFVQGRLLAAFGDSGLSGNAQAGRDALVQLYVAKSETTLTCWEDCTYQISLCLQQG